MILRFQADADLNPEIERGLRRREPAIDFLGAAGVIPDGTSDSEVLRIAAQARKHKTPEEVAKEAAHHAEMAKLYAQHVLKEQPTLQIQGLGGKKKASQPAMMRWARASL